MWESMDYPMEKPGELSGIPRESRSRASTHTATSMASTVLTRASNIIQIAYIPGVTNRQGGGQEPPVPPVPIPTNEDQLIFHPGDLRSSAFTDISEFNGRTRRSLTPSLARTSIASAVLGDNAVAVMKAKPALVSVPKSSAGNSPLAANTPLISNDIRRFGGESSSGSSTPTKGGVILKIPVSSDGIRTPGGLSPMPAGIPMKPRALTITRKGKGGGRSSNGSTEQSANSSTEKLDAPPNLISRISSAAVSSSSAESPHNLSKQFISEEEELSDDEDSAAGNHTKQILLRKDNVSPFTDAAAVDSSEDGKGKASTKPLATPSTPGSPSSKSEGPFGDDHAVKE
jgi:hypothetical protein